MSKIRTVKTELIKKTVIDLIYSASFIFPREASDKLKEMSFTDRGTLSGEILEMMVKNIDIAKEKELPLCQDCGSVIIFAEIGQNLIIEGQSFHEAINDAVEIAYRDFYLRKSIVTDPLRRENSGTNRPAFIHTDIVEGDKLKLTLYLKGGGSENMTSLRMFRPTDSIDMIIDYIEEHVVESGPNPCPPIFLGIGIGGTADVALLNAKKAVLRGIGSEHKDPFYKDLEDRIKERLNSSNVGPLGFGGKSTTGGVFIKEAPTHIATLPVALNLNCHSLRYKVKEI